MPRPTEHCHAAAAFGRRGVLLAAACAVMAASPDPFGGLDAAFAARLDGPAVIATALGMGVLRPGSATGAFFRQFLADALPGGPFASVEMRLSRTRPSGLAVLDARPDLPVTPDTVRDRFGAAEWTDVRPELPLFYLRYPRPGGAVSFGFPKGAGLLGSAVLVWGDWA